MRLAIALPVSDEKVYTQFFLSFMLLDKPEKCHLLYPKTQFHSADIGKIRTELCQEALDLHCTHILFLDTDQVYHNHDLIMRLLDHDEDIVGGKVHRRYPPFEPILNVDQKHVGEEVIERGGLVEVDATGTGCLMIKTDVLRHIPKPWFEFVEKPDGGHIGEDISFCNKAREAGYSIYVDCDVTIGHLALIQVGDTLHQIWKKSRGISS